MSIHYCCPICKNQLVADEVKYECSYCPRVFPIIPQLEMPDFRITPPTPKETQAEKVALDLLFADYHKHADFRSFMDAYIRRVNAGYLMELELKYELEWASRGMEYVNRMFDLAKKKRWDVNSHGVALDVGCGKGAMLAVLSRQYDLAVGVEYRPRYLFFAKKLCESEGIKNVQMFCGDAQALPFRANSFDAMTAVDVIEHIPNAKLGLSEMTRTLKKNGILYLNNPNRYNAFTPEDHVHIMWLGFLPRSLMRPYVRLRKKTSYDGVWLKSYSEFKMLLGSTRMEYYITGVMKDCRGLKKIVLDTLNSVLRYFVPSFNAILRK